MFQPLDAVDVPKLARASSAAIHAHLARFSGGSQAPWLSPSHPHQDGTLPQNASAFSAVPAPFVVESIAVRGPLHCSDGWGYLARSLCALLVGDAHAARHLAYYAELRGALSILASDGIGVFNRNNRVVEGNGALVALRNDATHQMAWAALDAWSKQSTSLGRILRSIEINNAPLFDALTAYFPSPGSSNLSSDLIRTWGFDLILGADDRDDRNLSSYSPNDLTLIQHNAPDDIDFVAQLWECFEPGNWVLERHLLRIMLELEQVTQGPPTIADRVDRYQFLDPRIRALVSQDFLARATEPSDHPLIGWSKMISSPTDPKAMIARGALLLKIATSMVMSNFISASVKPLDDLSMWWDKLGTERGFWPPGQAPEDMNDLWLDISLALGAVQQSAPTDRSALLTATATFLYSRLCETERIALWRFCR